VPKSCDSPMRLDERYGKTEYKGGKVIQRWRNVRLSHLLMSFLFQYLRHSDRLYSCKLCSCPVQIF